MRTRFAHALVLFAVSLLVVGTSRAELLVYEPFDYDVGGLDGQNGGTGFGEPWVESVDSVDFEYMQVVQPDTPMSYVVPGGSTITGGNRALQFANNTDQDLANDTEIISRNLASTINADDVYISYLYRYTDGFIDDNDFVVWWYFDEDGVLEGFQGPVIGLKGNGGNGSQPEDLIARVGNWFGSPQQEFAPDSDISDELGTDYFIVGRLSKASNSDDPDAYDQYDLWVNPGANDQDNPDASAIGLPENLDGLTLAITQIGMRAFSQEPDDAMMWDELRIGTTWDDVVNPAGGVAALQAGDANMDLEFNQLDLVKVQIAAKYLTGQPATWGEGDWNGAPGGSQGAPPAGDNLFNQMDIIAALAAGVYLTGPYAAISPDGTLGDGQTSVVYNAGTGELSVDAPAGVELTSINIDSAAGIFTGDPAENLGGSFDNDADANIFKATFGDSFGSLSFGKVAQPGLTKEFVAGDLTVVGSLAGGGDLGNVDLVYVPEPSCIMLLGLGLAALLLPRCRR